MLTKPTTFFKTTIPKKKKKKNPTRTTISRIYKKLKLLKDEQKLNDKTYLKIRPSDAITARFYGLPKVRKTLEPLCRRCSHSIVKTHYIENLLRKINNTTEGITFTTEEEKEGQIPFLDILLTKTNNESIETQVYRKETYRPSIEL